MLITYDEAPRPESLPRGGTPSKYVQLWHALDSAPSEWLRIDACDAGGLDNERKIGNLMGSAFRQLGRRIQVVAQGPHLFIRFRKEDGDKPAAAPTKSAAAVQKVKPSPAPPVKPVPAVVIAPTKPVTFPPAAVTLPLALIAPTPAVVKPLISAPPAVITPLIYAPPQPTAPPSSPQPRPAAAVPPVAPTPVPAPPAARRGAARDPEALTRDAEAMLDRLTVAKDPELWDSVALGGDPSYYETFIREVKLLAKQRLDVRFDFDRDGPLLYAKVT
jgi:hypothetical protein